MSSVCVYVCVCECACVCVCVCVWMRVCVRVSHPPARGQHGEDVRVGVAEDSQELGVTGEMGKQSQLDLAEV